MRAPALSAGGGSLGEARRRALAQASIIYHHTSSLRANLIWVSGVIELEGQSKGALHPIIGEIITDVSPNVRDGW